MTSDEDSAEEETNHLTETGLNDADDSNSGGTSNNHFIGADWGENDNANHLANDNCIGKGG